MCVFGAPRILFQPYPIRVFSHRCPLYKWSRQKLGFVRLLIGVHFPRHDICTHFHFSRRAHHRVHSGGHDCMCCCRAQCHESTSIRCRHHRLRTNIQWVIIFSCARQRRIRDGRKLHSRGMAEARDHMHHRCKHLSVHQQRKLI